jgi:hypothetical protein
MAAKVGAHVEDLLYMAWKHFSADTDEIPPLPSSSEAGDPELARMLPGKDDRGRVGDGDGEGWSNKGRKKEAAQSDVYMVVHHIVTAALCLVSWALSFTRIGSVVMFLHDVSDLPLDVVRLSGR